MDAHGVAPKLQPRVQTPVPTGALNPISIAHALAAALPENCVLVDESLTTGRESMGLTAGAAPHDLINNMGGSIGYGTPVATGVALACPDRRVPRIDWLAMGKSMGVRAVAVEEAEAFHKAMVDSTHEPGPSLIEVRL